MPDVIVQKMNSWRACIRKEKKLDVKNSIKKHTWHPPARAWSRQTFLIAIQIFMRLAQMQSFWSDRLDMFTELFVPGFASYRRWTKIAWQEIEHPFGWLACRQQLAVFYTNMTVEFWERKEGRVVARAWHIVSGMTLSFLHEMHEVMWLACQYDWRVCPLTRWRKTCWRKPYPPWTSAERTK